MDKETLEAYRGNRLEINQLQEEIQTLRSRIIAPKIAKYTGMPTAHGGVSDPTGEGVAAEELLLDLYERKHKRLCEQQLAIEAAIDGLPRDLCFLMRSRYIQGLRWETICELMATERGPIDNATVHRKHKKALEMLA